MAKHRALVGNNKGRYWDLSTENLEASIKEIGLNSEGSAETLSALAHRRGGVRTPRKNHLAGEGKRAWIQAKARIIDIRP